MGSIPAKGTVMRILEAAEVAEITFVIDTAAEQAALSRCQKDHRGAVVFKDGYVLGQACNGPATPYRCVPEYCGSVCGLYAMHAERLAIIDALARVSDLNGASILHVRVDQDQIQTSNDLRCEDCTGYMMRLVRKGFDLREFVLFQSSGWTAYSVAEADQITRRNLNI